MSAERFKRVFVATVVLAVLLGLAAFVLLLVAIWTGDTRWAETAGVCGFAAMVTGLLAPLAVLS